MAQRQAGQKESVMGAIRSTFNGVAVEQILIDGRAAVEANLGKTDTLIIDGKAMHKAEVGLLVNT